MSKPELPAASDRRRGDRRKATLASLIYGNWLARRRRGRRQADQKGYYVDWYEPHILCLTIGILLLSCADALLTLDLLEKGAREVNALIEALIHTDIQLFAAVKMGFTAAALIFLVIHHRFRIFARLRVNHVLRAVVAAYLVLLVYELALVGSMRLPGPTILIVIAGIGFAVAGLYLDYKQSNP